MDSLNHTKSYFARSPSDEAPYRHASCPCRLGRADKPVPGDQWTGTRRESSPASLGRRGHILGHKVSSRILSCIRFVGYIQAPSQAIIYQYRMLRNSLHSPRLLELNRILYYSIVGIFSACQHEATSLIGQSN